MKKLILYISLFICATAHAQVDSTTNSTLPSGASTFTPTRAQQTVGGKVYSYTLIAGRWYNDGYLARIPTALKNLSLTGTAGNGYFQVPYQASAPTAGTGLKIYANSLGALSWLKADGYTRTLRFPYAGSEDVRFPYKASVIIPDSVDVAAAVSKKLDSLHNKGYATLQDYGADYTGVTDATTAFRNAVASGKPLYVFGTYKVSDSINVVQNIRFESAVINFTGVNKSLFVLNFQNNKHLTGTVTVVGTGNTAGSGAAVHVYSGYSNEISGFNIQNFQGSAIQLDPLSNNAVRGNTVNIHHNWIYNSYRGYLVNARTSTLSGVEYSLFTNNILTANTYPIITYAGNGKFSDNNIVDNANGVQIIGGGVNDSHDTWVNNAINHNGNYEVSISNITLGEIFTGNSIFGSATINAFSITNSPSVMVTGGFLDGVISIDATSTLNLENVIQLSTFSIPSNSGRVTILNSKTVAGATQPNTGQIFPLANNTISSTPNRGAQFNSTTGALEATASAFGTNAFNSTAFEPAITAGTTSQYYRGDKTFQSLSAAVLPLFTGTTNQVIYNNTTGNFSLPQSICTTCTPTFGGLVINGNSNFNGDVTTGDANKYAFGAGGTYIIGSSAGNYLRHIINNTQRLETNNSGISVSGIITGTANVAASYGVSLSNSNATGKGISIVTGANTNQALSIFESTGMTANINLYGNGNGNYSGSLTGASFVKSGGTASQFLKADGSVDANTYLTGNQTITLTGDVTGSGTTSIATTIANSAVSNAKMANMAANTVKANNTGSSAAPTDVAITTIAPVQNVVGTTNRITVTPASNTYTLTAPQDLHTTANFQVGTLGVGSTPFSGYTFQTRVATDQNFAIRGSQIGTGGIELNTFNNAGGSNVPLELNGSTLYLKTGGTQRMYFDGSGNSFTKLATNKNIRNDLGTGGVVRTAVVNDAQSAFVDHLYDGEALAYTASTNSYNFAVNPTASADATTSNGLVRYGQVSSSIRTFQLYTVNGGTLNLVANQDVVINASPAAVNLPNVSTVTNGQWITIKNRGASTITITAQTGQIFDSAQVTTVTIPTGGAKTFMPDGVYWNVE